MSTAVPLPGPVPPAGAEFPSSQKCHSGYGGERWRVMGMLLVFLLLNLVTGSRSPSVWMDEVMYADPAINWLRGDGFTSTAWSVQHGTEFWASNVPLHAVLLRGWLALTGVSALAVRSLNYLLFAAACYLLWDVTRRHALIVTRSLRLAFLATLLLGFGVSASYRSGRYDGVGILLSAGIAAIALRSLSLGAAALLFVSAALLPWAGVQLLPYWFALGLIAWLVSGRAAGRRLLVIAAGIMCGAAALVLFYQSRGVLGAFVNSVFLHAAGPRHPASWNGIADPRQIDRSAAVSSMQAS